MLIFQLRSARQKSLQDSMQVRVFVNVRTRIQIRPGARKPCGPEHPQCLQALSLPFTPVWSMCLRSPSWKTATATNHASCLIHISTPTLDSTSQNSCEKFNMSVYSPFIHSLKDYGGPMLFRKYDLAHSSVRCPALACHCQLDYVPLKIHMLKFYLPVP